MTICTCLYPLHIVDKRDSIDGEEPIEYLAIPQEVIDEMGDKIKVPKIEMVKEDGFDYVKVVWADPSISGAMTKRYSVNDHIMVVGCDSPKCKIRPGRSGHSKSKSKSSKSECKCEEKEVYTVLHPLEEWHTHHIVEVR